MNLERIPIPQERNTLLRPRRRLVVDDLDAPARHRGAHPFDHVREPVVDRLAHKEVADIELGDLRQPACRLRGHVVETVAGMHLEPEPRGSRGPLRDAGELDAWGTAGDTLPLMRALKQQFDPRGVLNPGRFVGGI